MAMILKLGAAPYAITPEAGLGKPTTAEMALAARTDLVEWWEALHGGDQLTGVSKAWLGRLPEIPLAPRLAGVVPTYTTSGGPDGAPFLVGSTTTEAYREVITPSGREVIPNGGDWSIAFVGRSGTAALSTLGCVVGADGGTLQIKWRSSNLLQVVSFDAAGTGTTRVSITAPSSAWAYPFISYQAATGAMELWLNNALGTGTPQVTGLTLATHAKRLMLFGQYDEVDGPNATVRGDAAAAMVTVWRTPLHANSAARAALRAVVAEKYPSLSLAA